MNRICLTFGFGLALLGCSSKSQSPMDQAKDAFINARWDEAIQLCTRIVTKDAQNADVWMLRGRCFLGKQSHEDAIEDFSKVIVLRGDDPSGYYFRARAYRALNQDQKAEADIVQGHSLDPEYKRFKALGYFSMDSVPESIGRPPEQPTEPESEDGNQDAAIEDENLFAAAPNQDAPTSQPIRKRGTIERGGVSRTQDAENGSEDGAAGLWNPRLPKPPLPSTRTRKLPPGRQLASNKTTPGGETAKSRGERTDRNTPNRGAGSLLNRRMADVLRLDQPDTLPQFPQSLGKSHNEQPRGKADRAQEPPSNRQGESAAADAAPETLAPEDSDAGPDGTESPEDAPVRPRRTRRIPRGTYHFSNRLETTAPPMTGISSLPNSPRSRSRAEQRRREGARSPAERFRQDPMRERPARFQWPPVSQPPGQPVGSEDNLPIWNYSVPFPLPTNPPTTGTFTSRSTLPEN